MKEIVEYELPKIVHKIIVDKPHCVIYINCISTNHTVDVNEVRKWKQ